MHEDEQGTTRQSQRDRQAGKKPFALSQRGARILGAAAVLSMVAVIALIIIQGGFTKPSHISGMVYRGSWHRATADHGNAAVKNVNSDKIQYSSDNLNQIAVETLAALLLDQNKAKENYSLRQYYYSRGLKGIRYQTDTFLAGIPGKEAEKADKRLAKAMGISASKVAHRYSWLIVPGHRGSRYNADRYGFDIYWLPQALTPRDGKKTVRGVMHYNTKTKQSAWGTMRTEFLRKTDVGLKVGSFKKK
ncbi:hypothetical protein [Pseudoramibacter faecis]|uniref:hypothetical protein n=1 Tax=Pseudoramibacter faecis TaxID=3108534 RepID=UPI002E7A7FB7|nr:hypothetical protein [Pseudoramibacter sp. HA2172]